MKKTNTIETLLHPFDPVWNEECRILILGSFPSVKSRESNFYYGHRQNRFWRVLSLLLQESLPTTIEEKTELLLTHRIAVWDVLKSCEITGSSDASIRNTEVNDLSTLLSESKIRSVFCNGKLSFSLYSAHCEPLTGIKAIPLPSTSAANASYNLEKLVECWKIITENL